KDELINILRFHLQKYSEAMKLVINNTKGINGNT
ncbi:MAG: hypothetical protein QG635_1546, partial [Bacteroidota bacterium]|nr:hypothetical protein [Bacteroidota bacterium]